MRRVDKDALIRSKIADIMKLKYRRDLLVDQRESTDKIRRIESQIDILYQELENIRNMPEDDTATTSTNITIQGGRVGQINIDTRGNVLQNNFYEEKFLDYVDFDKIEKELSKLQRAMKNLAQTDAHDMATQEIEKARQAARKKDERRVIQHMKAAGQWALEVATKIGSSIAIDILRIALGIK